MFAKSESELNEPFEDNRDFEVSLVKDIIKEFPLKVEAYKNGKKGIVGMFMGEAMRRSGGKIDAKRTNEMMVEFLDNQV
ncbi:MAG: hypothetical protein HC811_14595 [Flammeovirgaceae bacterium]|nr:hypothetical protein [Flammeovirgaceae bacterium]